jgi:hypothetical protein
MGREIRRVPPNWEHPKIERYNGRMDFQPMFDRRFEDAAKSWKEGFAKWEAGLRPQGFPTEWVPVAEWKSADIYGSDKEWWEYEGGPPEDRDYYRPWKDEEATWFQVWETVSEGTPVTPPFATREELIDYLATHGDFWDQRRRAEGRTGMQCDPWDRAAAEKFVNSGWAPSMMVTHTADGGVQIKEPRDGI